MAALEKVGAKAVVEGVGKFNSDVTSMNKGVGGLSQKVKDSSASFKKAGLALSAFGAAGVLAIKDFVSASLEQSRAMATVGATVKNLGVEFDSVRGKIEKATAALQAKTNFGDEEQLRILAKMIPIIGDVDQAMAALPAVLDAATASGMDAGSVANTLTRALAGQVNQARSVGITFDKTADFNERLALVMDKVGGTAEANINPFVQLNNTIGDFKEKIGAAILPILKPVINFFGNLFTKLQNVNPVLLKVVGVVLTLTTALAAIGGPILLLIGFFPQIVAGLAMVKVSMLSLSVGGGPISLIIMGIAALIAIGWALGSNWDAVWSGIKTAFQKVWDFLRGGFGWIVAAIIPGGLLLKAVLHFKDNWDSIWNGIKASFKAVVNAIISGLNFLIRGMNMIEFRAPSWVPGIGGKGWGVNIPLIPKMAHGGTMLSSGPAIVGERGPEMVHLPAGASVQPINNTNYNVTANYSNPQEPQGIRLDLQSLLMMTRA